MDPSTLLLLAGAVESTIESVAFTAYDFFTTSESEKLIAEQRELNARNRLRASGVFSDADIATIMREYNDQVNKFAGGVAARGLGSSAVGASLISRAQQAPFYQAQRQAATQYQAGLKTLSDMLAQDATIEAQQREQIGGLLGLGGGE